MSKPTLCSVCGHPGYWPYVLRTISSFGGYRHDDCLKELSRVISARDNELSKLRAAWMEVEWWGDEELQSHMLRHGLIEEYIPIRPCGENCSCAEMYPTNNDGQFSVFGGALSCYRRTTLLTGEKER